MEGIGQMQSKPNVNYPQSGPGTQPQSAETLTLMQRSLPHVSIWTDGSSLGNPGPGGYGAILLFDRAGETLTKELSQGYRNTTNNRMEVMAAIAALEALKTPCKVTLYSDSQYLVHAHTQGWLNNWIQKNWKTSKKISVKNVDLWKRLLDAERPHDVTYTWVEGHAGTELNERCDRLAVKAASSDILLEDTGF